MSSVTRAGDVSRLWEAATGAWSAAGVPARKLSHFPIDGLKNLESFLHASNTHNKDNRVPTFFTAQTFRETVKSINFPTKVAHPKKRNHFEQKTKKIHFTDKANYQSSDSFSVFFSEVPSQKVE